MKQNLKQKMQKDLDQVTKKLLREEAKLAAQEEKVSELRRQKEALQSALNIMDGRVLLGRVFKTTDTPWTEIKKAESWTDSTPVEPGFKYVQGTDGHAMLVPINDNPVVLETPAPQNVVPPLESDSFVSDGPGGD